MNDRDNDHVTLAQVRGFVAGDLHGALSESYAISKATQCKQYLFSVSLNPPADHDVSEQAFFDAADRIEEKLGLPNQPRAIVFHEKEGRRHAHVVWSRIDVDEMKAINLPHFKLKQRDMSRQLYLDHGWPLPDGLATYGNKNPLNFTLAEWQQAKRQGIDPREIKQVFRQAWERSDSLKGLQHALEDRGYVLAKGDRRGFVALDYEGNIYSLSKWTGVSTKEVKAKLGSPEHLPCVEDTRISLRRTISDQMRSYIGQVKARHDDQLSPIYADRDALVRVHRLERQSLQQGQTKRWVQEAKVRQDRFSKGLRGVFDWFRGKRKTIEDSNIREALECNKRDQAQRDGLIAAQMRDRRALQERFAALRSKQREDRKILAREVAASLRRLDQTNLHSKDQTHRRNRGIDLSS
ncbi:MAG: relaxase/mobilization nuclease domain-containing protein [Roseovarius sp.]|nr:relaxase/mobilization nuclease domain-containing protein [Roseovarius sp.]